MPPSPRFALHYETESFPAAGKLMGRQASGRSLIKGLAARWPQAELVATGTTPQSAPILLGQMKAAGFRGSVAWRTLIDHPGLVQAGAVYAHNPIDPSLAFARNQRDPAGYSLIGVTHSLSTMLAMDQIGQMASAPFQPWDALVCTSQAARDVVRRTQAGFRDWMAEHQGATRFNTPHLPVIPLGVDTQALARAPDRIAKARAALGIGPEDVVLLFAGRLSFHAKASPIPLYQAAEAVAAQIPGRVVCIEAGQFFNDAIAEAYRAAQKALAPSVRFIWADGAEPGAYDEAWRAADVFTSLSDNIQETFGLTPVEAMAAGLPVVVADWDGYKDTVRDGIDGYRIATALSPAGTGPAMARRYAGWADSYDLYVGRASMATAVDQQDLTARLTALARDPGLRAGMGAAGQARARAEYDWSVVLDRLDALAGELAGLRPASAPAQAWRGRPDPFRLFAGFGTHTVSGAWGVTPVPDSGPRLKDLLALMMVNYALDPEILPGDEIEALHALASKGPTTVGELIVAAGGGSPGRVAALMLLYKLDLVRLTPPMA